MIFYIFFQMSLILRHILFGEHKNARPPQPRASKVQVLSEHNLLELVGSEVQCDKLLLGFSSSTSFDLQRLSLRTKDKNDEES